MAGRRGWWQYVLQTPGRTSLLSTQTRDLAMLSRPVRNVADDNEHEHEALESLERATRKKAGKGSKQAVTIRQSPEQARKVPHDRYWGEIVLQEKWKEGGANPGIRNSALAPQ